MTRRCVTFPDVFWDGHARCFACGCRGQQVEPPTMPRQGMHRRRDPRL